MIPEQTFLTWTQLTMIVLAGIVMTALGTHLLIPHLKKAGILDKPNKRSNHKKSTPRGGGVTLIGTYLILFVTISVIGGLLSSLWTVIIGGSLLMLISWIDDIRPLSPLIRLMAQIIATGLVVSHPHPPIFGDLLPYWLDSVIIIISWVWFINLYNFMDGVDGITCAETIVICMAVFLMTFLTNFPMEVSILAFILATCCLSFLKWNWHPAKIFLGDVGSIPLGFFVGWFLLILIMSGYWAAALILPSYYLLDSGITICKRLLNGKKIWEAHSEHYYQQAVRSGKTHSNVVLVITGINLMLTVCAILASRLNEFTIYAIGISIVLNILLFYYLTPGNKNNA